MQLPMEMATGVPYKEPVNPVDRAEAPGDDNEWLAPGGVAAVGADSFYEVMALVYVLSVDDYNYAVYAWRLNRGFYPHEDRSMEYPRDATERDDFLRYLEADDTAEGYEICPWWQRANVLAKMTMVHRVDELFDRLRVPNDEKSTGSGNPRRARRRKGSELAQSERAQRMIGPLRELLSRYIRFSETFTTFDRDKFIWNDALNMWNDQHWTKKLPPRTRTDGDQMTYEEIGIARLMEVVKSTIKNKDARNQVTKLEMDLVARAFGVFIYVYSDFEEHTPIAIYGPVGFMSGDATDTTPRVSIAYQQDKRRYIVNCAYQYVVSSREVVDNEKYQLEAGDPEAQKEARKKERKDELEALGGKPLDADAEAEEQAVSFASASRILDARPGYDAVLEGLAQRDAAKRDEAAKEERKKSDKADEEARRMRDRERGTADGKRKFRNPSKAAQAAGSEPLPALGGMAEVDLVWTWENVMRDRYGGSTRVREQAEAELLEYALKKSKKLRKLAIEIDEQEDEPPQDDSSSSSGKKKPNKYKIYLKESESRWLNGWKTPWHYQHYRSGYTGRRDKRPTKQYEKVTNNIARRLWEAYQGRPLAPYKRCFPPKTNAQNVADDKKLATVEMWMKGYIKRPQVFDEDNEEVFRDADPTTRDQDLANRLRCQIFEELYFDFDITIDERMKYALSSMSPGNKIRLQAEYECFMSEERKHLMDILKACGRKATMDELIKCYDADGESYAKCTEADVQQKQETQQNQEKKYAASTLALTGFTRVCKPPPPSEKTKEGVLLKPPEGTLWQQPNMEKEERDAKEKKEEKRYKEIVAVIKDMKEAEDKIKEEKKAKGLKPVKDKKDKNSDAKDIKHTQYDAVRADIRDTGNDCNPCAFGNMPKIGEEGYFSAMRRWMEFEEQLSPSFGTIYGPIHDMWRADQAVQLRQDPLIAGPEFVYGGRKTDPKPNLLMDLLLEFVAYAERADPDYEKPKYIGDDHRVFVFGDKSQKYKLKANRTNDDANVKVAKHQGLTSSINNIATQLLHCFPKRREGNELNSIMDFICWYMQNAWHDWVPEKQTYQNMHDKMCELCCLPAYSTWKTTDGTGASGGGPRYSGARLRGSIGKDLRALWRIVTFSKKALDYAVANKDSILWTSTVPRIIGVRTAWIAMTTPLNGEDASGGSDDDPGSGPGPSGYGGGGGGGGGGGDPDEDPDGGDPDGGDPDGGDPDGGGPAGGDDDEEASKKCEDIINELRDKLDLAKEVLEEANRMLPGDPLTLKLESAIPHAERSDPDVGEPRNMTLYRTIKEQLGNLQGVVNLAKIDIQKAIRLEANPPNTIPQSPPPPDVDMPDMPDNPATRGGKPSNPTVGIAATKESRRGLHAKDHEVEKLVDRLRRGQVTSLGRNDKVPEEFKHWAEPIPQNMNIDQWKEVFAAAVAGKAAGQLGQIFATGTLNIHERIHHEFVALLSRWLPFLGIIALNIGEIDFDQDDYDALEKGLEAEECIVGHLYIKDPANQWQRDAKRRIQTQLTMNRYKLGYHRQLVRDEVYAFKGAQCWHEYTQKGRNRAKERVRRADLQEEARPDDARDTLTEQEEQEKLNDRVMGQRAVDIVNEKRRSEAAKRGEAGVPVETSPPKKPRQKRFVPKPRRLPRPQPRPQHFDEQPPEVQDATRAKELREGIDFLSPARVAEELGPAARRASALGLLWIDEVTEPLESAGFERSRIDQGGDCFMLAALAGFEISAAKALNPPPRVLDEWPDKLRKKAFDLLTGDADIGPTKADDLRKKEFGNASVEVAKEKMKQWLTRGFWYAGGVGGVGARFAGTFQLAIAILLERPIAVITKTKDKQGNSVYQDLVVIYGQRDAETNKLLPLDEENTTTYKLAPFDDVMQTLADNPIAYSVIEWNGSTHYSAWVLNQEAREQAAAKKDAMDEGTGP